MALVDTLLAVGLDLAAVGLLGWCTWIAVESWERPSAPTFAAIAGLLAAWAAMGLLAELAPPTGLLSTGLWFGRLACGLFLPGAWVLYALSYTGRGTSLTRLRVGMLVGIALPVLATAGVLAAAVGLDAGLSQSTAEYVAASMLGTELLYLLALFCYGTFLVVGLSGRHDRVTRLQVALVTFGVASPYLLGAAGSGSAPADGVTLGFIVGGGLLAVSLHRYPMLTGFHRATNVARSEVFEGLQEAVVVVDWEDRVVDANAATERLFGESTAAMLGEPLRSVVDGIEGADLSADAAGTATLDTTRGRRTFQYTVSAVDQSEHGGAERSGPVARTVLFRDVTDRRTREQRLAVLNRVLRHNVRNELDVLLAHADRVEDETTRGAIRERATELLELGDEARAAEEVMSASTEPPAEVDLVEVARSVVEAAREDDRPCDVSLSAPEALRVETHREIVERVLSELVDNAIEHADPERPSVTVSVREAPDGTATLAVADDGSGIPERERRVVEAGTETPLEHGTGIGLWLVDWAVTQLGGEIDFGDDAEGSVVTVRLPGERAAAGPASGRADAPPASTEP